MKKATDITSYFPAWFCHQGEPSSWEGKAGLLVSGSMCVVGTLPSSGEVSGRRDGGALELTHFLILHCEVWFLGTVLVKPGTFRETYCSPSP